jgi:hypothetical protein
VHELTLAPDFRHRKVQVSSSQAFQVEQKGGLDIVLRRRSFGNTPLLAEERSGEVLPLIFS